jgi:general secretion pathway protein C
MGKKTLEKYFWLVITLFVVLAALFSADTVNMQLLKHLFKAPPAALKKNMAMKNPRAGGGTGARRGGNYQIIEDRFIFNSQHVPPKSQDAVAEDKEEEIDLAAENFNLIGTLAGMGKKSVAIIENAKKDVTVVALGEKMENTNWTLTKVLPRAAYMMSGKKTGILKMPGDEEEAKKKPGEAVTTRGYNNEVPGKYKGIYEIGKGEYEVDRQLVDNVMSNFGDFLMQGRVMANYENGQVDGFKVMWLKNDSLFRQIGLNAGDVVKSINGSQIKSLGEAFEMFDQYQNASNVALEVMRDGQPQTVNINLKQ